MMGTAAQHAADDAGRLAALRARLLTPLPADGWTAWAWALLVTLFGGFLRFNRLSTPRALAFDETYYAKDAWSILQHGVEWNMAGNANDIIQTGHTNIFACTNGTCGEWVVQPEVGKYLIAVGEWLFGLNSFGWRFSTAVFGTLSILLVCRIGRRLTRSTLLGCVAGLLMSLDGLQFVLSRTGILDIFLMFFVLAGFGCMLIDRDQSRERLAVLMTSGQIFDEAGPRLGIRKWRVWAGIFTALAIGTKWDAVWYLIAFAALGTAWDVGMRRAAGLRSFWRGAFSRDAMWLPLTMIVIPFVVYVATWSNWLITKTGYYRLYADQHGVHFWGISALYSLFEYHVDSIKFGVGLKSYHPYMSQPWDWLVMTRPVAFWYQCYTGPVAGAQYYCPKNYSGPTYSQEVLALGSPAIWWVAILALTFLGCWWLLQRDWRAGGLLAGVIAGWLPWWPLVSRTKFYYYALEFEPFVILGITLCLGLIIGKAADTVLRRSIGAGVAGAYLLAVLLTFVYFYPIWSGSVIPYHDWLNHMWYRIGKGWI
jgi:dolichyl-phosphate-mannose-protein mannosyltransferase